MFLTLSESQFLKTKFRQEECLVVCPFALHSFPISTLILLVVLLAADNSSIRECNKRWNPFQPAGFTV